MFLEAEAFCQYTSLQLFVRWSNNFRSLLPYLNNIERDLLSAYLNTITSLWQQLSTFTRNRNTQTHDQQLCNESDCGRWSPSEDKQLTCPVSSRQVFISDLVLKLHGLQKQEDLHNDGIDLPQLHIYPTRSGSADREMLHWDSKRTQSDPDLKTCLTLRTLLHTTYQVPWGTGHETKQTYCLQPPKVSRVYPIRCHEKHQLFHTNCELQSLISIG